MDERTIEQMIVLPTRVRLEEEGSAPGAWSRFFDAALAWVEAEELGTELPL